MVMTPPRAGKERAVPPDDDTVDQHDAPETTVASQEGHWRAGVNRQAQLGAAAHQVLAGAARQAAFGAAPR